MRYTIRQISKKIALAASILCLACFICAAQHKSSKPAKRQQQHTSVQLAAFIKEANEAGIDFVMPPHFKELPAVNNENFSFDYAMSIPGHDFEIWFQVHSLKQNWASYEQVKNITGKMLANPDSTYLETARANALAMSDDGKYFTRLLPDMVLQQYNASAGKTFLFNLADLPDTRHYKYALLIALQKDHTGYLVAVCFSNTKGPEFFKNINKAQNCMKFR